MHLFCNIIQNDKQSLLPEESDWKFIALSKFYQIIDCRIRAKVRALLSQQRYEREQLDVDKMMVFRRV